MTLICAVGFSGMAPHINFWNRLPPKSYLSLASISGINAGISGIKTERRVPLSPYPIAKFVCGCCVKGF